REGLAWTLVQLGKRYWPRGLPGPAERQYRAALAGFRGYVYGLDALAQVEAARGRPAHAIALERQAVDTIPLPQFVGLLGDLYRTTGRDRLARRQYALVAVIQRLLRANGVRTDLETALCGVPALAPARPRPESALFGPLGPRGAKGSLVKRLALLAGLVAALLAPAAASAHPLGNFTINRFSRLEVRGDRMYVLYVLDMAEIPTYQAGRIDPDAYARRIAANAHLTVDGRAVTLVPVRNALAPPPGARGLR